MTRGQVVRYCVSGSLDLVTEVYWAVLGCRKVVALSELLLPVIITLIGSSVGTKQSRKLVIPIILLLIYYSSEHCQEHMVTPFHWLVGRTL